MAKRLACAAVTAVLALALVFPARGGDGGSPAEGRGRMGTCRYGEPCLIPAGTKIAASANENVDGVIGKEGRVFPVLAAREVRLDGTTVIAEGALGHARIVPSPEQENPPGHMVYGIELVDIVIAGGLRQVDASAADINVDTTTRSPYPGPATGVIIPKGGILEFTVDEPAPLKGGVSP